MRHVLVILVLASSTAHADLDADRERKEAEADLAKRLGETNEKCGTKLTAAYDWASEKSSPSKQVGSGPGVCRETLIAVGDICTETAEGKKAVQAKIKKVACKFNAKVTTKKSKGTGVATDLAGEPAVPHTWIQLSKSTLQLEFDWFLANTQMEVAKYLHKQL